MATLDEVIEDQDNQMAASNQAGLDQISYFQEIEFKKYIKCVLPIDGYVFWVNSQIASVSALYNRAPFNMFAFSQKAKTTVPSDTLKSVKGSLHYSSNYHQDEDETFAENRVVFTAQESIQEFNDIAPNEIWIGSVDDIRFAFSSRSSFYEQAGLWHYEGIAIYPDMETQIYDGTSSFSSAQIVSNSLPIWLAFNDFDTCCLPFSNHIPFYPSYLVPDNIRPPFVSVHIEPGSTDAFQLPVLDKTYSSSQLTKERVRLTLWGLNNEAASNLRDFVLQQSQSFNQIGIMNIPVIHDEKRVQSELGTIAQKKTIEFEISYYQSVARDIAHKLIKHVVPTFIFQ